MNNEIIYFKKPLKFRKLFIDQMDPSDKRISALASWDDYPSQPNAFDKAFDEYLKNGCKYRNNETFDGEYNNEDRTPQLTRDTTALLVYMEDEGYIDGKEEWSVETSLMSKENMYYVQKRSEENKASLPIEKKKWSWRDLFNL